MKIDRILFATDLGDHDNQALDYASSLADSFKAELHIVHVADLTSAGAVANMESPYLFELEEASYRQLEKALHSVKPTESDVTCIHHCERGNPAEEIVSLAKREKIDLIVMASHGRRGVARVLLGSVAENVLRHSECPVLIVRQHAHAKEPVGSPQ